MQAQFLSDVQIESLALSHRRALGFCDNQAIDAMTLITKVKSRYDNFNYLRVPDDALVEAEAQWDSDKKLIIIPESVFCDTNREKPRAIFTIMHEISHALLRHRGILNRGRVGNRTEKISIRVRAMEY